MNNLSLSLRPLADDISFATEDLPIWQRKSVRLIEGFLGKRRLMERYHEFLEMNQGPDSFWDDAINCMGLDISCYGPGLSAVPRTGPLVIVANHPFGLIDGAAICWLLSRRRDDFKVILWDVFSKRNHGEKYFLPLDLAEDCKRARRQNLRIRKAAIKHLRENHSILIFPSGSAEKTHSLFGKPYELPWLPFTEKLISATGASVLPVFVHGHNSRLFHIASQCSETLRLAMFFHEINRKMHSEIELSIGEVIGNRELLSWSSECGILSRLRDKTMALSTTRDSTNKKTLLVSC